MAFSRSSIFYAVCTRVIKAIHEYKSNKIYAQTSYYKLPVTMEIHDEHAIFLNFQHLIHPLHFEL